MHQLMIQHHSLGIEGSHRKRAVAQLVGNFVDLVLRLITLARSDRQMLIVEEQELVSPMRVGWLTRQG